MTTARLRWRLLRDLDDWLVFPMSILAVGWLVIVLWELVSGSSALLETLGTVIWMIFIAEFGLRLSLAPDKWLFIRTNWLTVIALAVPALRIFRTLSVLRAARGLRGLRLIRIVGTANRSMNALRSTLRRRGFGYVAVLTVLVVTLAAAGMLNFESAKEVRGGFRDYWEALWWTGMLVTSIGSEFWPRTTEGRLLTFLVSLYGLAVLGYITATLASFFVGRDAQGQSGPLAGSREVARLTREIRQLRRALQSRMEPQ